MINIFYLSSSVKTQHTETMQFNSPVSDSWLEYSVQPSAGNSAALEASVGLHITSVYLKVTHTSCLNKGSRLKIQLLIS